MSQPNSNIGQIQSVSRRFFLPRLYDNVFLGNPMLRRAKTKGWKRSADGGEKVIMPLEYAEQGNSDWYNGADTLNVSDSDTFTAAELDWKQLYAPVTVSRRDELKNMGKAQVVDFVKSKMKNAEKTMKKKLSVGIYSDGSTDPDSIVGLRSWIGVANSPGGISQSANSWYQGQVDSTTTTLTISALQTQFNAASEDDEQPSVAVGTKAVFNSYYALLQPQQRFTDGDTAKGGFTSLMFNGIPFISDTNVPSSHLIMANEDHLHLICHRDEDMRMTDFDEPINQNVKVAKIYWMGVLGSTNNRYHALFSALTA